MWEPMRKPNTPPDNRTPRIQRKFGPRYRVDRTLPDDSPYLESGDRLQAYNAQRGRS